MNAAKRSKYNENGLGKQDSMTIPARYNSEVIAKYATENTPLFWKDIDYNDAKRPSKKTEEDASADGAELGPGQLPNTVGPNENIYGGFPINDALGGFELPSPETLAMLKMALRKFGPRNGNEAELHHDLQNWAFDYEHHALPEYDVKETPPFYINMLERIKMAEKGKGPGCEHMGGGCGSTNPVFHLNDDQCNILAGNCMPSKPVNPNYEEPCPWKIIEMLFGCRKPAKPMRKPIGDGKPDEVEPKPDNPEKPPEDKGENEEGKKPKPIPLELGEGHATPGHIQKQVEDIKDDAKNSKGEQKNPEGVDQAGKLISQLGLMNFLATPNSKQGAQSRMEFSTPHKNATSANSPKSSTDRQAQGNAADASQKAKESSETSGNTIDKNEVDLSILPVPESIQISTMNNKKSIKDSKSKSPP